MYACIHLLISFNILGNPLPKCPKSKDPWAKAWTCSLLQLFQKENTQISCFGTFSSPSFSRAFCWLMLCGAEKMGWNGHSLHLSDGSAVWQASPTIYYVLASLSRSASVKLWGWSPTKQCMKNQIWTSKVKYGINLLKKTHNNSIAPSAESNLRSFDIKKDNQPNKLCGFGTSERLFDPWDIKAPPWFDPPRLSKKSGPAMQEQTSVQRKP